MPRRAKPFFHRGWWCSNVGGTRTKLAQGRENKSAAEDALLDLLGEMRHRTDRKTVPQLTVKNLGEKFLDWAQIHRAERTYEDYRDWLNQWVKLHGDKRARDIRSIDLEDWKTELASRDLAPSTLNHAVVAVKRCWSWGTENELLPRNPLAKVKKLYAEGRERIFTPDEFRLLLRRSDALFRQVLLFLRLTGVRPGEFRRLTWDQVDFENHVLMIRRHHKSRRTAKERRARIVHLPPIAENMLKWRLKKHGRTQRVFLNHFGLPWSANALRCRMRRLRIRAGIKPDENGEQIVLYTTRHTYGSRAAAAGVSDRRLADLMGHTDPKMTQKYGGRPSATAHQRALDHRQFSARRTNRARSAFRSA